ncbi:hypothetical protein QP164_02635 [Sphingomonas sp. LR59]|uniref:hypothetical protein n=1 Tax=Sphingomonas sp. LR59 TaxID=3050232 RepID=UPI002FE180D6
MYLEDGDMYLRELSREQRRRPDVLVQKLRRRRAAHDLHPLQPASLMNAESFGQVHSAAEFAARWKLPLDTMITIDLARMGVATAQGAASEVRRFLKCSNDYLSGQRKIPAAWIYAIENGAGGFHAHIAMHVPGVTPTFKNIVVDFRAHFREWARGYTGRQFGKHIPRAIYPRAPKQESWLRHWINVSYLLKGYDRSVIVRDGRNCVDGRAIYLGDLIAAPFVNPGIVDLTNRVRVSHSLGPAQRAIGSPPGLEYCLPQKPNWAAFDINRSTPLSLNERLNTVWTLPTETPFQSRWEAGFRDARMLYPSEFYRFVTKQEPFNSALTGETSCESLFCQLAAMADPIFQDHHNPLI